MVQWIRKRLALRSYRRKLGPALVKRYGREPYYTINQVQATVAALELTTTYLCYAYADCCSCDDFQAHYASVSSGERHAWAALRREMTTAWGVGSHHLYQGGNSGSNSTSSGPTGVDSGFTGHHPNHPG